MPDLTADDEAAAMVAAVRDDPALRLDLAARFYDRRVGRPSIRSYRRAERPQPAHRAASGPGPLRSGRPAAR